jgi:hypothetical protein
MLARKLSVSELRDYDSWDLDRPARGWDSWQQKSSRNNIAAVMANLRVFAILN